MATPYVMVLIWLAAIFVFGISCGWKLNDIMRLRRALKREKSGTLVDRGGFLHRARRIPVRGEVGRERI